MTYHHYNRLLDHYSGKLTPSERLIALYLAQAIREKTNRYSESVRRLCNHLDLSEAGVKRSLKKLEEVGLFRVNKSYLSTYSRSYELAVSCPEDCLHLEDHNTKPELAQLAQNTTRRIKLNPLSYQIEPPYIENLKEEEEGLVSFEGEEELGLLVQILNEASLDLNTEQLLEATKKHPRTLAKALFSIATKAKLDTTKRKRTYFEQIVKKTPLTLLKTLEDTKALEVGRQLLSGSTERALDLAKGKDLTLQSNQLPRAHTWKRLNLWLKEMRYEDLNPKGYLAGLASNGKLEEKHLLIYEEIKKALVEYLKPINFGSRGQSWEAYLSLSGNEEDGRPELRVQLSNFDLLNQIGQLITLTPDLLTAEELPTYELREAKLYDLKEEFLKQNSEENLTDFYRSEAMGKFLNTNPEAINAETKAQRFIDKINLALGAIADQVHYSKEGNNRSYQVWLENSFTWQEDLESVLDVIPARLEGHKPHLKKFEEAYIQVRAKLGHQIILGVLTDWGRSETPPSPSQYALSPDKYLLEKLADRL